MIPGVNLLKLAMGVITPQSVVWRQFKSRTQNALGNWVNTYHPDKTIRGSLQPMSNDEVHEMGFDVTKHYWRLYTSHPIDMVGRGESPDIIIANGRKMEVVSTDDWYSSDGWKGLTLVEVGAA